MGTGLGKEDLLKWQAAVEAHAEGDAEFAYNNLCEMDEQPAPIVFNLAMMHCSAGNFTIAHTMLTEAIGKNKHFVIARFQRAWVSHRLEKNEDAMLDYQVAIEMMRDADFINYHTLGLEYVFCRYLAQFNLAVIRLVLGLRDMSAEVYHQAIATKARMEADAHIKDIAKEQLQVGVPDLVDYSVEPCRMNHEHGECPLIRLPPHLLYKPAGLGKDILKTAMGEKKDYLKQKQAKVLFSNEASGHAYEPGFRGRLHVEEFMPMAISTKHKKKNKKKPGSTLSGLIKSATPRIMMVKPVTADPHPQGRAQSEPHIQPYIKPRELPKEHKDVRGRSKSLFVVPSHEEDDEDDDEEQPRAKDDGDIPNIALVNAMDEEEDEDDEQEQAHAGANWSERQKTEVDKAAFLRVKKTSIGQAKSVEVLYAPPNGAAVPETRKVLSDSETASSSHDDDGYDSRVQINVTTQMTPTTLRDLADLLEHLQVTDKQQKFIVNVHMHQSPPTAM
ncbi:uncharacterized protein LOC135821055 [Sycon ciliatum]|uniref:uncharacterized protein LOC135821055 n=1 Tax=Sycon ciliatum TaxID=27933 RepID=UPI0031F66B0E